MLKIRIITALLVLPIVLVALFMFPDWAWGVFTLGIVSAACWEWAKFCQFPTNASRAKYIYFVLSAAISAVIFLTYLHGRFFDLFAFRQLALFGFAAATVFWLVAAPLWLARVWRPESFAIVGFAGWLVIFPTWLALLLLHDRSPWLLLSVALIVWVADVAAYFVGKAVGKHKLAPTISPGKTIEGALGGIVGVALYFFLWQSWSAHPISGAQAWALELGKHGGWLFGFFILLGVLSVMGDLFESWMKRGAGLKDSSGLLPGHGGILDRIDALTSTLPVAGLYMMLTGII